MILEEARPRKSSQASIPCPMEQFISTSTAVGPFLNAAELLPNSFEQHVADSDGRWPGSFS
jgi:hypothetical protein